MTYLHPIRFIIVLTHDYTCEDMAIAMAKVETCAEVLGARWWSVEVVYK